jgi:hypothetical protein
MKTQLNEIKRMQQLAGIINENESNESTTNEMATLMSTSKQSGEEKPIVVGDLVAWKLIDYSNDRGMGGSYAGAAVGEVIKILGSRNVAVKVISPSNMIDDVYKVDIQKEGKRIPKKGEKVIVTVSYNSGAGSGSQGTNKLTGTVVFVNMKKPSITIKRENGENATIEIMNLQDIKYIN